MARLRSVHVAVAALESVLTQWTVLQSGCGGRQRWRLSAHASEQRQPRRGMPRGKRPAIGKDSWLAPPASSGAAAPITQGVQTDGSTDGTNADAASEAAARQQAASGGTDGSGSDASSSNGSNNSGDSTAGANTTATAGRPVVPQPWERNGDSNGRLLSGSGAPSDGSPEGADSAAGSGPPPTARRQSKAAQDTQLPATPQRGTEGDVSGVNGASGSGASSSSSSPKAADSNATSASGATGGGASSSNNSSRKAADGGAGSGTPGSGSDADGTVRVRRRRPPIALPEGQVRTVRMVMGMPRRRRSVPAICAKCGGRGIVQLDNVSCLSYLKKFVIVLALHLYVSTHSHRRRLGMIACPEGIITQHATMLVS